MIIGLGNEMRYYCKVILGSVFCGGDFEGDGGVLVCECVVWLFGVEGLEDR